MSSLHFSNYAANQMLKYTFESYISWVGHVALGHLQASGNEGYFRIFKGTVPTDFSFATNTTTYTRTSDKLIEWIAMSGAANNFTVNTATNTQPFTLSLAAKTAVGSGTATWFWWCSATASGGTTLSLQMVGTVGTTGSGADIEIPVVDIVSGQSYRLTNVRWGVPSAYSY